LLSLALGWFKLQFRSLRQVILVENGLDNLLLGCVALARRLAAAKQTSTFESCSAEQTLTLPAIYTVIFTVSLP